MKGNNFALKLAALDQVNSCQCPIGFEPVPFVIDRYACDCHHVLKRIFPFISDSDCNSETLLFLYQDEEKGPTRDV